MPKVERQFTIGRWVLWTAAAAMFLATMAAPSYKFVYPLVFFIAICSYIGYMLGWGLNTRPRKLTIEEEWKIEEISRDNAEPKE